MVPADLALQRRRNSRYGAFVLMLGVVMIFVGTMGCFNALMHFVMLNVMPTPPGGAAQFGLWRQANMMMITAWPPLPLAGLSLAVSGFYIRRHSAAAMRIARWTTLAGYGWGAAIAIHMVLILFGPWQQQMLGPLQLVENAETFEHWMHIAQLVFGCGVAFGPPTVLLWMLRRVRPIDSEKTEVA